LSPSNLSLSEANADVKLRPTFIDTWIPATANRRIQSYGKSIDAIQPTKVLSAEVEGRQRKPTAVFSAFDFFLPGQLRLQAGHGGLGSEVSCSAPRLHCKKTSQSRRLARPTARRS